MDQPSIYPFGFPFHEPVTSLTNLILCFSCFYFGNNVGKSHANKYWSYFFYTLAFSTGFAALGHGLYVDKNNILQLISRSANIIAVCLASLGSILYLKNKNLILLLTIISMIQLLVSIIFIIRYNEFWIVKRDAIFGLGLIVGGVNLSLAIKGNKASLLILGGIIVSAFTAYIHTNKIYISKWFNHNDISHLILLIGFYLMAKGASKLHEYATTQI